MSVEQLNTSESFTLTAAEYEKAFKTFYASLCRTVYKLVRDKDASEDIVQEVFIAIWKNKESLKINTSLKAYLFRASVNSSFNYLQKSKRLASMEEPGVLVDPPAVNSVEETVAFKDLEALINKNIDRLPAACRSIFILSRYEQMSYKEIAETLQISVKTVENQMSKALKVLRENLHEHVKDFLVFLILINF
ncbi:MAG TPA: RNA polymerase sigma-70 factor [Cytophagaceae bacterium]